MTGRRRAYREFTQLRIPARRDHPSALRRLARLDAIEGGDSNAIRLLLHFAEFEETDIERKLYLW